MWLLTRFLRASLGSGLPAGPQRHHAQSAAGTSAVEDQHAQMGARGPTQNHHMTGPSQKLLGPNLWVKGTIALCVRSLNADMFIFKSKLISTFLNTCTVFCFFFLKQHSGEAQLLDILPFCCTFAHCFNQTILFSESEHSNCHSLSKTIYRLY